jgi:hypothetical protein
VPFPESSQKVWALSIVKEPTWNDGAQKSLVGLLFGGYRLAGNEETPVK